MDVGPLWDQSGPKNVRIRARLARSTAGNIHQQLTGTCMSDKAKFIGIFLRKLSKRLVLYFDIQSTPQFQTATVSKQCWAVQIPQHSFNLGFL